MASYTIKNGETRYLNWIIELKQTMRGYYQCWEMVRDWRMVGRSVYRIYRYKIEIPTAQHQLRRITSDDIPDIMATLKDQKTHV